MSESKIALTAPARTGARWTGLSTFGGAVLTLLQLTLTARILAPEDFGRMAIVLVITTIGTTFSELGLSSAIIQRKHIERDELGTLYSINLLAGALLFVAIWISAPFISSLTRMDGLDALIRAAGAVFLISPWGLQFQAMMQKNLQFTLLAWINFCSLAFGVALTIALAYAGLGVWSLLIGHLSTRALMALSLLAIGSSQGHWPGLSWQLRKSRSYLAFGGFRLGAMVANSINARIDQLVVGTVLGPQTLGVYNVAQRLVMDPVQRINPVATRVLYPLFSIAQDDPDRIRRGYLRMISILTGISAPLLFSLAGSAHVAVPVLLGPGWDDAVTLLRILAIYALIRSIANAGAPVIMASGRADWTFYWNVAMLAIVPATVLLTTYLTRSIIAVAISLVILQAALTTAHYALMIRRLIGPCGLALFVAIGRPTTSAAIAALTIWRVDALLGAMEPFGRLIILLASGLVAYLVLSWFIDRDLLREMFRVFGLSRFADRPSRRP